jgi:hypothetical protein
MLCSGLLILFFDYQYIALAFGIILWYVSYQLIYLILVFWTFGQNISSGENYFSHLTGMILGVVITFYGARGFTGIFFGTMFTAILLAIIFEIMKEDMKGFIDRQGTSTLVAIFLLTLWIFTSLYVHFQKFFNQIFGAMCLVRGLAHWTGGFPNEVFVLIKIFEPSLIDKLYKEDELEKMSTCSKKVCW